MDEPLPNRSVLVPMHLLDALGAPAADLGVSLSGYDQQGLPCDDSRDAVALFRWWLPTEAGESLLREFPAIRWVHTGSAGVDHILTGRFVASGITLTNSAGVHAPSIAEWVVATILAEEKCLEQVYRQQRERVWSVVRSSEVGGRHAVILGGGTIAKEISRRLRALDVRVTAVTRSGTAASEFDAVAQSASLQQESSTADWLIVAAPLTAETRGIVSHEVLGALPRQARVINVARGELVDEPALLELLLARKIAGAILDVFDREPLPAAHPFWEMDNVRVLPHTTWRSDRVVERQLGLFLDNLGRFVRDEPLRNVVDPGRGY